MVKPQRLAKREIRGGWSYCSAALDLQSEDSIVIIEIGRVRLLLYLTQPGVKSKIIELQLRVNEIFGLCEVRGG
jgi:hypothetical protein